MTHPAQTSTPSNDAFSQNSQDKAAQQAPTSPPTPAPAPAPAPVQRQLCAVCLLFQTSTDAVTMAEGTLMCLAHAKPAVLASESKALLQSRTTPPSRIRGQ